MDPKYEQRLISESSVAPSKSRDLALLYFPLKQFSHRFGDNIFTVGNDIY